VIKSSIILTTYNRPDALHTVLSSLAHQHHLPDEVLIADDGSGPETAKCVQYWQKQAPFQLYHVWQPDRGFRAAAARNRAIARALADYIIFLDGDCLTFPDFIQRHLELAEAGWFLVGNRLLLDRALTQRILTGLENPLQWSYWQWLHARGRGETNRLAPLLRLSDGAWRKCRRWRWQGVRTCNLGVWRQDVLAVNGFDERYQGWGHEDADLVVRLLHLGRRRKDGQFAVPVAHLWHAENDRSAEKENQVRLENIIKDANTKKAIYGLDQHL
jgi:glycosyltransferase involved in cell wall biosynthesis